MNNLTIHKSKNSPDITKYLILWLSLMAFFLSCDDPTTPTPIPIAINSPDTEGNLCIINKLDEPLYLWWDGSIKKEISSSPGSFLVSIPNPDGPEKSLKLWKKADVPDINNPDDAKIFRTWDVVLATGIGKADCSFWVINDLAGKVPTGTLIFSYPKTGLDDLEVIYSVDLIINGTEGITTISPVKPGSLNKQVGIEYGYYILHYHYWYSDPDSSEREREVGWIKEIQGDIIQASLNAGNDTENLDVPFYYDSSIGRIGTIKIRNNTNNFVKIWANNVPIEDFVITQDSTVNLSIIKNGGSYSYNLPEATYHLKATNVSNGSVLEMLPSHDIIDLHDFIWIIPPEPKKYQTITIVNDTNEKLSIHDHADAGYLGFWLRENETRPVRIETSLTGIRALTRFKTHGNYTETISSEWQIGEIISLDMTPPANVTEVRADAENNSINLSWHTPTDSDFGGVKIVRNTTHFPATIHDGIEVFNGNTNSCTDTEIVFGTIYYYKLYAYDESVNYSEGVEIAFMRDSEKVFKVISDIYQLQAIQDDLSASYILSCDIDASETKNWNQGAGFTPIGSVAAPFTGTFDGNGYTITNLYIDLPTATGVGLFSRVVGGVIKNIGLINADVFGDYAMGILVGSLLDKSLLFNSYTTGHVTISARGRSPKDAIVGGLVGCANQSTISQCYSIVNIIALSDRYAVGGLCGSSGADIGDSPMLIINCYASGTVTCGGYQVAGLLGDAVCDNSTVSQCYSTTRVNGAHKRGLIGYNYRNPTIEKSYWDIQTSTCSSSIGGIGKNTTEMMRQATFIGWDFTEIWAINENTSYPFLRKSGLPVK